MNKRILVVLPSPLMARNFLRSDSLQLLRRIDGLAITVVSPNPDDRSVIESAGGRWLPFFHPLRSRVEKGLWGRVCRWGRYLRYLMGLAIHMSLTFRFNTMAGFRGFAGRLKQSWSLRKIYLREGLPMSRLFGVPFPRSVLVYRVLHRLYYSGWQGFGPVNRLLAETEPDLMILTMIQTHMVTPYALAAVKAGVPILGVNGSWDQPTTKGPVCPGVDRILTQNEIVRDELVCYHGIPSDRIAVIGWLQMDTYAKPEPVARNELLRRLGVPSGSRYILFAANAPRLGSHEPALVRELAARVQAGTFGDDVVMVCRCHPQDRAWEMRWGWVASMSKVIVEPPDLGPLEHLAAVIRNAGVVVASAGSINLDAVALDVPTIGVAWEDEDMPYWDRPARAYNLEHLADLRATEGIRFVGNLDELIDACNRYLGDVSADAEGRARLRQRYLFRLDGGASVRLVGEVRGMLA
jgi:hypothetical protein